MYCAASRPLMPVFPRTPLKDVSQETLAVACSILAMLHAFPR
jgi:hypothetical protein